MRTLFCLCLLASTWFGAAPCLADESDLRVMSFNIRYGTANDGPNHWDKRRDDLLANIKAIDPDLLGTQETLKFQRDWLAEKLPQYGWLGIGRDDGNDRGEMMALYYKKDRFTKLDGGHFWLSETPEIVGSKSWDSSLPRMVTWVKLRDKTDLHSKPIVFFNTHFDHQGETARQESAKLLRRKVSEVGYAARVIVTGDFNADEGSGPYRNLFAPIEKVPSPLLDTFRTVHPERDADEGTFSGFQADAIHGARIDWIGVSRDWEIRKATIDRTSKEGRTPSDHFAVTATLQAKPVTTWVYCSAAKEQSIDLLRLDTATGEVEKIARYSTPGEPAALAISPDGNFLMASLRSVGKLASFRIDPESGSLTAISVVDAGKDPGHISLDRSSRYLLAAYYVSAKVSVHRIAEDGMLSEKPHQELPTDDKAHGIMLDRENRFAFVPHTGPSTIFQFQWDRPTGKLKPASVPRLDRPAKTGPRHLVWHPTKPIAYIDNEQANSVTAYKLGDDGLLVPGQTETTLPPGFTEGATAEIKVHPNGRYLYVSNRGHDSIAVLQLDESGEKLKFVAAEPTEKNPRSFDIDASGRFLLAAGETSGNLAVYTIDDKTGRLTRKSSTPIGPMLWWVQTLSR
jgi:6-phosphogluconolactonase (cycloisomerase 2 family)/endonuclease/exonuclease/phosphatase family metal-dependent hydrolase